jgi:hypothetical protein
MSVCLHSVQIDSEAQPASLQGMKLTAHFYLVSRLIMRGAIYLRPTIRLHDVVKDMNSCTFIIYDLNWILVPAGHDGGGFCAKAYMRFNSGVILPQSHKPCCLQDDGNKRIISMS